VEVSDENVGKASIADRNPIVDEPRAAEKKKTFENPK
jgi:hypothetical protein